MFCTRERVPIRMHGTEDVDGSTPLTILLPEGMVLLLPNSRAAYIAPTTQSGQRAHLGSSEPH
jgi:hypothetical protein